MFERPLPVDVAEQQEDLLQQLSHSAEAQLLMPFQEEEFRCYVHDRVQCRKTSGMTGISAELMHAMTLSPTGIDFMLEHCNASFTSKQVPTQYLQAFVCLVPKTLLISVPKQYRPLCLLESVHKLLRGLVFRRLLPHWPKPVCHLGALPGSQAIDCLLLAQTLLYCEYKTSTPSIWVLLDLQQAFDNLRRASVLQLLLTRAPAYLHHESMLLWKLLQCRLHFCWGEEQWGMHPQVLASLPSLSVMRLRISLTSGLQRGSLSSIDFLMEPLSMGGPIVMTSSSTLRAGKSWP